MKKYTAPLFAALAFVAAVTIGIGTAVPQEELTTTLPDGALDAQVDAAAQRVLIDGRRIFRGDTFGNQAFWGDTLRLHEAIAGRANGGVGPGVSPETALAVGLKVDFNALPGQLRADLRKGRVDLTNPATTIALLKLDAVVGRAGVLRRQRPVAFGRHHLRALPLGRGRFIRTRHRPAARRMGGTRPGHRDDHRALSERAAVCRSARAS